VNAILGFLSLFGLVLVVSGLAFAASPSTPWVLRRGALFQAIGVALATVGLVLYVQTEDSYRDNGTSRWDAYGAHEVVIQAVALGAAAVALLLTAWIVRRRRLGIVAFLGSMVAAGWIVAATLANSLNYARNEH
jgi:hypothetical protein